MVPVDEGATGGFWAEPTEDDMAACFAVARALCLLLEHSDLPAAGRLAAATMVLREAITDCCNHEGLDYEDCVEHAKMLLEATAPKAGEPSLISRHEPRGTGN